MLPMFTAKKVNNLKKGVIYLTISALSVYGVIAFTKRGFPGYMFGKTVFAFFDYDEPRICFFIDYVAIMILFMITGCLVTYVLKMRKSAKK